jgi:hypothetical protein
LIYRIRVRAKNVIGYSTYSTELLVALSALPLKPATPYKIALLTTKYQIGVEWAKNADSIGPGGLISGYKLYMAEGLSLPFHEIYNGTGFPTVHNHVKKDLTTG